LLEKTSLLAGSARFDLCCACSQNAGGRQRSVDDRWIYPAALPDGRTIRLLKILQTNVCNKDCQYCENRVSRDVRRESFAPEELAGLFVSLHQAGKAGGLFLSSGIAGRPDRVMERMTATAEILRRRHRFRGYIHMKILPGSSRAAVERAAQLSDRISINIEAPGPQHLERIAGQKDFGSELLPQTEWIRQVVADPSTRARSHTTQFVVGASGESDREILKWTDWLYKGRGLYRAYYSAYQIPDEDTSLDAPPTPLMREHRLYQSDFLLRKYGFSLDEFVFERAGHLSLTVDPKERWAQEHPEAFPVEIMTAPQEILVRVPGLGPVSAKRICSGRRQGGFRGPEDLRKTGLLLKKAAPYLLLKGKPLVGRPSQLSLPFDRASA
jgi:predicted DNA-binding helix-hairpin-helix protein